MPGYAAVQQAFHDAKKANCTLRETVAALPRNLKHGAPVMIAATIAEHDAVKDQALIAVKIGKIQISVPLSEVQLGIDWESRA